MLQVHFRDTRVSSDRKIPRTGPNQRVWNSKLKSDHSESQEMGDVRQLDGDLKCRPDMDSKLIPSFFSAEWSQT